MRKLSKTNPLPKGSQNVAINMPRSLASKLNEVANLSGLSRNAYCAKVLNDAANEPKIFKREIVDVTSVASKFPPHRPGSYSLNEDTGLGQEHKG